MKEFTKINSVSKTLRFELKPTGATLKNINSILEIDKYKNKSYPKAKEQLDEYYMEFIKRNLKDCDIDFKPLYDIMTSDETDSSKREERISKEKANYRKLILNKLKKDSDFKILFKKEIIEKLIKESKDNNEIDGIVQYNKFSTFFTGFFQNRENIFTDKEISTGLPYRAINVNFDDFVSNVKTYNIIEEKAPYIISTLEKEMKKAKVIDNDESINDIFSINFYSKMIIQEGINKFNTIVGGISNKKEEKIKGFNELIKEYNDDIKYVDGITKERLPLMIMIKRQILSEDYKDGIRFSIIETDKELLDTNLNLLNYIKEKNIIEKVKSLFSSINTYDTDSIFISDSLLNSISVHCFGDYKYIKEALKRNIIEDETNKKNIGNLGKKEKKLSKKEIQNIENKLGTSEIEEKEINNKEKYLSISFIEKNSKYIIKNSLELSDEIKIFSIRKELETYMEFKLKNFEDNIRKIDEIKDDITEKNIKENEYLKYIKDFLDSSVQLYRALKLLVPKDKSKIDLGFYSNLNIVLDVLSEANSVINMTRNYVTKVDFSKEKIKLMFNLPEFASGWSKSKENSCGTIILREQKKYYRDENCINSEKYYLGILNHAAKIKFDNYSIKDNNTKYYEKMEYYLFKEPNKMIPKCLFTKKVKNHFEKSDTNYVQSEGPFTRDMVITKELYDVYHLTYDGYKKFQKGYKEKFPQDEQGYRNALNIAIDGCKEFLSIYETTLNFDFSKLKKTEEYESIDEFYADVENACYKINFVKLNKDEIDKEVERGNLFLFEIYNKDFSPKSRGSKNLHTLYFLSLFDKENEKKSYISRLNGGAEVFFRKKSIENPIIHKAGKKVISKTYLENGIRKSIPNNLIPVINEYINGNKEVLSEKNLEEKQILYTVEEIKNYIYKAENIRELEYDIVKDKRYSQDKFHLHVPITINSMYKENLYERINDVITKNKMNVIGIDRGEKNLLYVTVLDYEGNILEQKSLNIINGFDYHKKLDDEEKRRDSARKSWNSIGKIKDLKEGYISMAVHEITKLVVKYKAIIVMENLNSNFKRGRLKFEKQVYQKFEKQLTEKLNYLAFKDRGIIEEGGILNGYQFTLDFNEHMTRNGIILYVNPSYTSKIDPTTGFVNIFRKNRNIDTNSKKEFLEKMEYIKYSKKRDMFVYKFDYLKYIENFNNKFVTKVDLYKTEWEVYTNGARIFYVDKKEKRKELTKTLKKLLEDNKIEYQDGKDIKDIILLSDKLTKEFYDVFRLAIEMRNSINIKDIDYIISPILNNNDEFFDTRNSKGELPINSDANGAYNIARKGQYILNKYYGENPKGLKIKVLLTNREWFEYTQKDN